MKKITKLLVFLLVGLTLFSCSKDELQTSSNDVLLSEMKMNAQILSFDSKESFIEEYSRVSKFNTEDEFQQWSTEKGHQSLLMKSDSILNSSDSIGVLYSDAFLALFNTEAMVEIDNKKILLDKGILYVLTGSKEIEEKIENNQIFGRVQNYLNETTQKELNKNPGEYIPNANRWKTYVDYKGTRRLITELYNETIIFDGNAYSSKMYLRFRKDYESCSFWRCTWKNDTGSSRIININIQFGGINTWPSAQYPYGYNIINTSIGATGHYNFLIANHNQNGVEDQNFFMYGEITTTDSSNNHVWVLDNISWY